MLNLASLGGSIRETLVGVRPGSISAVRPTRSAMLRWDQPLFWVSVVLLLFGLVMVYSASIALYDSPKYSNLRPTYFLVRQAAFIVFGLAVGVLAFRVPTRTWQGAAPYLFMIAIVLLVAVLIPGIGKGVNGAHRWIPLWIISLQPSELMKFACVLYAADFTVRKQDLMHSFRRGFAPMIAEIADHVE